MSTQTTLNYRTNRDLFSNYHLDEHLPETEAWDQVDDDELQAAYDDIKQLWEREKDTAPKRNESQLEDSFIRPMFRNLDIPFEVEESTEGTQRRPDYGFFKTEEDGVDAFQRREEGGDFYKNAIAVADAKRWGRKLDTRGKKKRDYENPSHQIDQYLRFTSTTWGVLTNGQKWRLYYKPTSHRLDSYYEIDLPTVLEQGDLEDFKYFYLFFRHDAFVPDASGDAFLDDVYEESNVFAQELGEDLQDNIYEAIKILAEGYLQYPENDLDEENLEMIHDSSLIYLYRIIFVLYAEAEGRDLLDTNNEIYESQYSLNQLKQEVADELESGDPKYRDWQSNLQSRLDELFILIDQGSKSRGIPEDDLYIPAYNGGLFRTNPDESGSKEARFLTNNTVGDEHLARVIELLTRSKSSNGGAKIFVDYSSLDVRHLGSVYEGLLEYQLNVADEPLALDDGEYVIADKSDEVVVESGDVYLTTGSGERKSTGSYYTPEYVVEYIVDETLRGKVDDIRKDVVMDEEFQDGGYAEEFAERIFDLKILDPAMGSGHFLTSVVDYLARAIITEQNREAEEKDGDVIDDEHDINWARRKVAQQCIYGVDINPLATELAKVSLWLRTLAAEQPLAFLDHHLKTGNSLVGSDIQEVLVNDDESKTDEGQLTLQQSFAHTRKQALDHVMDRFSELLAIDNETLEDAKEMEDVYQSVQSDPLYQKLLSMANVHTADQFGLDIPSDADERMAESLRDDSWEDIESQDWFKSAQAMAKKESFFHWELEFPVAFYDIDGNRVDDPGFDAVIGNPPYVRVQNLDHDLIDYLKQQYQVAFRRTDISLMFFEAATELCKSDGRASYISSLQFRNSTYGEKLREYLAKRNVKEIVDFGDLPIFEDATTYAGIIVWKPDQNTERIVDYIKVNSLSAELVDVLRNEIDSEAVTRYRTTLPSDDEWTFTSKKEEALINELEENPRLSEFAESCTGMFTGRDEIFLFDPKEAEESDIEDDIFINVIRGGDPQRWHLPQASKKSIYPYKEINGQTKLISESDLENKYPNAYEYLVSHKEELAERQDSRENIVGDDWYKLTRPGRIPVFKSRKIITSGESKQNQFCIDEAGSSYSNARVFSIVAKDISTEALLGVLNSKVAEFYLHSISRIKRGGYYSYSCSYLDQVPIPAPIDDNLEELITNICDRTAELDNLNLNLRDYIGDYSDGKSLDELYMPTKNIHDTILTDTADDKENLRFGEVRVKQKNGNINLYATARYKPTSPEEYDTDQWGYTETDPIHAMQFTGLDPIMKQLLLNFVPIAVEQGGGFASFRETATKTKSLMDRLGKLNLPDLNDVESGMNRYVEINSLADNLTKEITELETQINQLVYDMYGLSREQIEMIESSVDDY